MSNQYIDELTNSSIKKFTRYLSLPVRFNIANPPDEWLRDQESGLRKLPAVLRRPENDSLTNLVQRGLMKISEKQSLPLVPESAVLCRSHRGLNPWRIRSLFVLLASEVTDKLERMRRPVRKNSDLAQDSEFRDFVWRMTSVQGLWMERAAYRHLYEHAPLRKEMVNSQCEACICAVVGGDPRLLVDFKAHLHSRARKFQPVLLRVVESWIDAFEDQAAALHAESAVLGEKLRRIRTEIGVRRHNRRQRHREAGKAVPYSKAKHDDVSKAAPAQTRSSTTQSSSAASDAYKRRAPGSGYGRSSTRSAPPADYVSDEDVDEDDEDDDYDERQLGSFEHTQRLLGKYHRKQQRGDGQGFDTVSRHPFFQNIVSRPTAQVAESSMSIRDVSRSTQTTPPHVARQAPPTTPTGNRDTSVRGYQSEWEGFDATRPMRQSSQSRTSRSTQEASSAYSRPASVANYPPAASRHGSSANGRRSSTSSHTRASGNNPHPPAGSTNHRHTTNPARISPESETVSHPPPRPVNNRPVTQDFTPEGRHDSLYPAPLNIRRKGKESPADVASAVDASFGFPPPFKIPPSLLLQTSIRGSFVDVGSSLVDSSFNRSSLDESALDDSSAVVSSPHV